MPDTSPPKRATSRTRLDDRNEYCGLVEMKKVSMPEELRHARWLIKEREEYLVQARRDAEDIVEAGRVQAERMVERTEVAREARRVAQQVISQAEADSRRLRHEAEDYIDQKLAAFEVVLERTMATVVKGREQLQAVVEPLPTELPDEHTGLESMYETEEPVVYDFDQDDG